MSNRVIIVLWEFEGACTLNTSNVRVHQESINQLKAIEKKLKLLLQIPRLSRVDRERI